MYDRAESKIQELRETSGTNETSTGGTPSGVTAASAIAALQEASGKTSRDGTLSAYRAYARVIGQVIELIRQFYDIPRQFRITGKLGEDVFEYYDNSGIKPRTIMETGLDKIMTSPVFDVKISAQRKNAYSKYSKTSWLLNCIETDALIRNWLTRPCCFLTPWILTGVTPL